MALATENPLVEGLERLPVPATTLVIFGASGDLSRRKLLPALYNLAHEGALPERFSLIGVSRRDISDEDFRSQAREAIQEFSRRQPDPQVLEGLLERMQYIGNPFDNVEGYAKIGAAMDALDEEADQPLSRVYYLSTAPEFFPVITEAIKQAGLHRHAHADVRAVIEKPFGTDLASARSLQDVVHSAFRERQVFRIDHYLGKETVQNVMAFRFANYMFEPVWNRNYIDQIQITAAEDIGIGSRAGYYDSSGALRDLVQNHMLQLLTLVCMEPPTTFEANKVRDEKVKVLQAIEPPTPEQVAEMTVRARYTAGVVGGNEVPGYLEEEGVPPDSNTETYAALRLEVHNWRWAGVPIFLRTGKRLARKVTEIAVQLKPVPHMAFQSQGVGRRAAEPADPHRAAERGRLAVAGGQDPGREHAHPPRQHGVPVRDVVHVAVAGGVRAADPRRDARRRDAVHPQRRGRRPVVDHRPDPQGVEREPAAAGRVRGRHPRPRRGGRADRRGPALEAAVTTDVRPGSR